MKYSKPTQKLKIRSLYKLESGKVSKYRIAKKVYPKN